MTTAMIRTRKSRTVLAEKLWCACKKADVAAVAQLFAEGADPDGFMSCEGAPLAYAVSVGNVGIVRMLLDAGADVDLSGPFHGCTPLELACREGQLGIAKVLVKRGANINKKGYWVPLKTAICNGKLNSIRFLLMHGADFESGWLTDGNRHRQHAVQIMEEMIKAGADVNHHEYDNHSDPLVRGHVPLHSTCNFPAGTKTLLDAGADPNRQLSYSKNTPLILASKHGNLEVVRLLLEAGANIATENAERKNAEQMAKSHGHRGVVQFLRQYAQKTESTPIRRAQKKRASAPKRIPSTTMPPKITLPTVRGAAAKFKTGVTDFISFVDEFGGACAVLAVESPLEKLVTVYSRVVQTRDERLNVEIRPSKKKDSYSNRWISLVRLVESPWTIIYSHIGFNLEGADDKAKKHGEAVSKYLHTRVMVFLADESGTSCHLFERGKCVGANGWEDSGEGADVLFRKLRLFIPECYTTEEEEVGEEVARVAVRPSSRGNVASVALVLPKG